jgi:cytochrome b561
MELRNTDQTYGTVAKSFHWLVALLILGLLVVGMTMVRMKMGPDMFKLIGLHKSTGLVVLGLATLRVLWRFTNRHVASLPNHQQWEKLLASLVHWLLYAAMFVMPLSGWIMSSAKGFSVSFFGLFTMPDLVKPDENLAALMIKVHNVSAYTLIVIIGLHIAGALKHHLFDRDNTLLRMLPCFKNK